MKNIFQNFEIYISKFLFWKKIQIIFENLEIYIFWNLKQIFFSKKKFFKFSQKRNLDTNLGKFRFFEKNPFFFRFF